MKSPIKNLFINSIGVLLTSGIGFLMIPAYTSAYGIEGYAIYATWIFVIALCQFLDLGYSTTVIKFSDYKKGNYVFLEKVSSYECVIMLSIICLTVITFFLNFPASGIYSEISNELGAFAVTLFFLPVFISNIVKFYSFAFLAKGHFYIYNFSVVFTELVRQIGGFFVLKYFESWAGFFYYQILSSIFLYLLFKLIMSFKCGASYSYSVRAIKKNISDSFDFTRVIFFSAFLGAVMSTFDRAVLTFNFTNSEVAAYSACFVVASVVNMVIQPFHRLTLPLFIQLYDENKISKIDNILISLSSMLSLTTLLLGGFMILFAEEFMPFLLLSEHSVDISSIIAILTLSFWFIACGWLPANLLQAIGKPSLQMKSMIVALIFGGLISLHLGSNGILVGVAAIWFVHGLIQFLFIPIISAKITGYFSILKWFSSVVLVNLLLVTLLFFFSIIVKSYFGSVAAGITYIAITLIFTSLNLFRFKKTYAKV